MTVNQALAPLAFILKLLQIFLFPPTTNPHLPRSSCDLMQDLLHACVIWRRKTGKHKVTQNDGKMEKRQGDVSGAAVRSRETSEGGSLLMMVFKPDFLSPSHPILLAYITCYLVPSL